MFNWPLMQNAIEENSYMSGQNLIIDGGFTSA